MGKLVETRAAKEKKWSGPVARRKPEINDWQTC
jgi:hypothetical protein